MIDHVCTLFIRSNTAGPEEPNASDIEVRYFQRLYAGNSNRSMEANERTNKL